MPFPSGHHSLACARPRHRKRLATTRPVDAGGEPGELTVGTALTEIVPLHALMSEKIETLQHWARGRARNVTHRDKPGNGRRKLDL